MLRDARLHAYLSLHGASGRVPLQHSPHIALHGGHVVVREPNVRRQLKLYSFFVGVEKELVGLKRLQESTENTTLKIKNMSSMMTCLPLE